MNLNLEFQELKSTSDEMFNPWIDFQIAQGCELIADKHAVNFSKYVLSQIYNMTHGDKAGISIEDLLIIYKKQQ